MRKFRKKKSGIVSDLVSGTTGIILATIIALLIVSTLLGADLLSDNTGTDASMNYTQIANRTFQNFTTGIANVSTKIPTILLIGAVVLLFGVIVLLVQRSRQMGVGQGSSL